jgi:hypothetical protein
MPLNAYVDFIPQLGTRNLATGKGGNVQNATLKLVQFEKSLLVRMLTFLHVYHLGRPIVFFFNGKHAAARPYRFV